MVRTPHSRFLGVPSLGSGRTLERWVGRPKMPGAFWFLEVFLPMSWLLIIMMEAGRTLVRGCHLLKLDIKDFNGLFLSRIIQGAG